MLSACLQISRADYGTRLHSASVHLRFGIRSHCLALPCILLAECRSRGRVERRMRRRYRYRPAWREWQKCFPSHLESA